MNEQYFEEEPILDYLETPVALIEFILRTTKKLNKSLYENHKFIYDCFTLCNHTYSTLKNIAFEVETFYYYSNYTDHIFDALYTHLAHRCINLSLVDNAIKVSFMHEKSFLVEDLCDLIDHIYDDWAACAVQDIIISRQTSTPYTRNIKHNISKQKLNISEIYDLVHRNDDFCIHEDISQIYTLQNYKSLSILVDKEAIKRFIKQRFPIKIQY